MTPTDSDILSRLKNKDSVALTTFYTKHKTPLLSFIQKTISDTGEAEELMQDVFLDFIEGLRDFREKSSLKTYLFAIAKYKIIDKLRRKKIRRIFFSHVPSFIIDSFATVLLDDELDRAHVLQKIDNIFSQLPHDYARVLRLKYVDGRSVNDIALEIQLPFKTTESLLFRARKAFISAYEQHE